MENEFLRSNNDNRNYKERKRKEKNHVEEINNKIIRGSFPKLRTWVLWWKVHMKCSKQWLKSHTHVIVKLQNTRDEKTLKAFRERWKKKIAHKQWKSEWQTFQKQPWKLEAKRGIPSKFWENQLQPKMQWFFQSNRKGE